MSFSVFFYASLAPKEDLYTSDISVVPLKDFFLEHHALLSCLNTTISTTLKQQPAFNYVVATETTISDHKKYIFWHF